MRKEKHGFEDIMRKEKNGFIIFFIICVLIIALVIDIVILSSDLPDWFKLWLILK